MRSRAALVLVAEVSLALLTVATVIGMGRLFAGAGWLLPLTLNAAAAHLLATLLRRRGLSLPAAAVLMTLTAMLAVTWTTQWSTTVVGLPTASTWSAMVADLGDAWSTYQDVIAPAPVVAGFIVAACLAIWCVAYVADWAAFRLWVPFEATLPAGTLFLFTALLGSSAGRAWAIVLYAGALLGFLLLHRMAREDRDGHWGAGRAELGHRALLRTGGSLALVAVLTGAVVGPLLPGADSPGVLDPRSLSGGGGSRVTISPLVDIRSRLVEQAAVEVFQVRSPQRSYWRLTSLETFDGTIWSSSGSYGRVDGALPEAVAADVATETFEQSFEIEALAAIWLPSAYEPRALDAAGLEVRYDEDSATLIVDNDVPDSDNLTYRVTSASPRIGPADLGGFADQVPQEIRDRFTQLPADFSPRVSALAVELTRGVDRPADKARVLQDHLRGFEYSLEVQPGHSGDVLEAFLLGTQVGYCEQFAGAFAAMARSIGLPARVAVGFTPGEEDPGDPGLYRVRGEYAHAWPEVFIAGAGWVAYEPTPGRGIPAAEPYTGVPEQQAAASQPGTSVAAPPTTSADTIPSDSSGQAQDPRALDADLGADESLSSDRSSSDSLLSRFVVGPISRILPWLAAALALYLILFPLSLVLLGRLRRRRASTPGAELDLAWSEALAGARLVGFEAHASHTYPETAGRMAAALPAAGSSPWDLALALETGTYSPAGAGEAETAVAWAASAEIRRAARESAHWRASLRHWLDPRVASHGRRRVKRAKKRRITMSARGERRPPATARQSLGSAPASDPARRRWHPAGRTP